MTPEPTVRLYAQLASVGLTLRTSLVPRVSRAAITRSQKQTVQVRPLNVDGQTMRGLVAHLSPLHYRSAAAAPGKRMDDPQTVLAYAELLKGIAALAWPLVATVAILAFKRELRDLLSRIRRGKGSLLGEWEFEQPSQAPSTEAPPVTAGSAQIVAELPAGEFLTEQQVKAVVATSGVLPPDDQVRHALLIFATSEQHTWLVSTETLLFCLLDDVDTRAQRRIVQWYIHQEMAEPISAQAGKDLYGRLRIDEKGSWLYSTHLFPDPADLERRVRAIIGRDAGVDRSLSQSSS